jgi:glycosyltransferase involved in cell wall biosynthesis
VRLVLVGTDLAPVEQGAGAIENLLVGWARELSTRGLDIHVISFSAATSNGNYEIHISKGPEQMAVTLDTLNPHYVVLNNRPLWDAFCGTRRTLHLFHNFPDAWGIDQHSPVEQISGLGFKPSRVLAAVSHALAQVVAATIPSKVPVRLVTSFVDEAFFQVPTVPEPTLTLFPNRLMKKKGVLEVVRLVESGALGDTDVIFLDYISPWKSPTPEHLELRSVLRATPRCQLWPAVSDTRQLAMLYARSKVVLCPSVLPEGLGLVAIEAQASGAPVVTSGKGGLSEATFLEELICDPTDLTEFAQCILDASSLSGDVRDELRIRAERYTLTRSVDSLEEILGG